MNHPHPYFGGRSAKDGRVQRLNAANFTDLLDKVLRRPVCLGFSRADFNSWPEEVRNERKDGRHIVCAGYDYAEEGERVNENATSCNLVILDLDEGEHVRDLFENPEVIGEHLHPYNYAVWTTAKHTPKAPRLKIAVDVQRGTPVHRHKDMVLHVAGKLGIPSDFKGVKESMVISQPQYLPVKFQGENYSTILCTRSSGRPLSEDDLPDREEDPESFTYASEPDDQMGALSLASLPVMDLTVEDMREPLFALDPDIGYMEWTQVCRALRHQFLDEDEARQAFELFDEWSSGGTKYRGSKLTYAKWKSFRAYPKGRDPITVRSLFKLAQDHGWSNSKLSSKVSDSVKQWIEQCDDADTLMVEGAKRIAAMPFSIPVVEEALILFWRKKLVKLTGDTVDKKALRDTLKTLRKRDRAAKRENGEENTPPWLQCVTFIAGDDAFHDSASGIVLPPSAFDHMWASELMPKDAAEIPANGKPVMMPTHYALNIVGVKKVNRAIYNPQKQGDERIFTYHGQEYLNLFNPNTVPASDPDYAEKAGRLFMKLLSTLVAEPEYQRLIIDYFAFTLKHPGEKIRWVFLIQSAPGVGKSTLGKVLRGIYGGPNVAIVNSDVIKSEWNDWMVGHQFYIIEEMLAPGERRMRVMNTLKPWITDDIISVNKRNNTAYEAPNFANFICFTNHRDAIHLEPGDRRWCVLFSPYQTKAQVEALNATGHFDEIQWLTTPEGAQGLRFFLKTWRLSDMFNPNGPAPRTRYADMVIEDSKPQCQRLIEDVIASKDYLEVNEEFIFPQVLTGRHDFRDVRGKLHSAMRELGYERTTHDHSMGEGPTECWAKDPDMDVTARLEAMKEVADFEV